jgi:hypothetical protein
MRGGDRFETIQVTADGIVYGPHEPDIGGPSVVVGFGPGSGAASPAGRHRG